MCSNQIDGNYAQKIAEIENDFVIVFICFFFSSYIHIGFICTDGR